MRGGMKKEKISFLQNNNKIKTKRNNNNSIFQK